MRPQIFSSNLPPINAAWTFFTFKKMLSMQKERDNLQQISSLLRQTVLSKGLECPGQSHTVPIVYGSNEVAVNKSLMMQQAGFYALPIRYPTVSQSQARVRVALHAALRWEQLESLVDYC